VSLSAVQPALLPHPPVSEDNPTTPTIRGKQIFCRSTSQ
jgi:hypothetical protein